MSPMLLIHGAFSHAGHLDGWVSYFTCAGYDCHAPTLPGHGAGDCPRLASLGMNDYLAVLRQECSQLPVPPIIVGHSMGGLLAQQLAASVPCAALVCVASAPPWMLTAKVRAIPYLAPLMPAILTGRPLYPRAEVFKNIAIQDLTEAEQRVLLPTFVAESGRAYRSMIFGLARLPGPSFQGPVLCISGGQDRIISNRISAAIARLYRARHEVFANRGHWLIALSAEREVASAVERWLRENSLGG